MKTTIHRVKTALTLIGAAALGAVCLLLATASAAIRTAVRDGFFAVLDLLLGGTPDTLERLLYSYPVAILLALLCAALCALCWYTHRVLYRRTVRTTVIFVGSVTLLIGASALISGALLSAAASLLGGFGCIGGVLLYGWLQKKLPAVFNRETVSYIIFGVLTTVVSFVSQMLFASLGTPAWVNTIGSWVCAVIFAYVVNKLFVFESRTDSAAAFWRELWLFFAARLASLGMELVFMVITVDLLHFSEAACKLIAQVFILIANYIFSKLVIFKKNK